MKSRQEDSMENREAAHVSKFSRVSLLLFQIGRSNKLVNLHIRYLTGNFEMRSGIRLANSSIMSRSHPFWASNLRCFAISVVSTLASPNFSQVLRILVCSMPEQKRQKNVSFKIKFWFPFSGYQLQKWWLSIMVQWSIHTIECLCLDLTWTAQRTGSLL